MQCELDVIISKDKSKTEVKLEAPISKAAEHALAVYATIPEEMKAETVVTSTIPPSVAAVDSGYLAAVEPQDVLSKTDVSGKPVEQISDVFITSPEPEIIKAGIFPELKTNTIIIAAIVLFFILSR